VTDGLCLCGHPAAAHDRDLGGCQRGDCTCTVLELRDGVTGCHRRADQQETAAREHLGMALALLACGHTTMAANQANLAAAALTRAAGERRTAGVLSTVAREEGGHAG
jgi:hypothetical protein